MPGTDVTDTTVAERVPGLVSDRFGEETVVLDPEQDRYVRLNRSGTLLWDALDQPASCGELARRLAQATGVSPERARADAAAFLRLVAGKGLLALTPPVAPPG